jgi:hypothetical protein
MRGGKAAGLLSELDEHGVENQRRWPHARQTRVTFDPVRAPRDERSLFVTGMLKPDVTLDEASADLERVARQLQSIRSTNTV